MYLGENKAHPEVEVAVYLTEVTPVFVEGLFGLAFRIAYSVAVPIT